MKKIESFFYLQLLCLFVTLLDRDREQQALRCEIRNLNYPLVCGPSLFVPLYRLQHSLIRTFMTKFDVRFSTLQPTWRLWGEERGDGVIYTVYLKKVRYHRPTRSLSASVSMISKYFQSRFLAFNIFTNLTCPFLLDFQHLIVIFTRLICSFRS